MLILLSENVFFSFRINEQNASSFFKTNTCMTMKCTLEVELHCLFDNYCQKSRSKEIDNSQFTLNKNF